MSDNVWNPTHIQHSNLGKLATYLVGGRVKMKFEMASLCENMYGSLEKPNSAGCGTVGCALGHGPEAGISGREYTMWTEYCKQEFGLSWGSDAWLWCFSGRWSSYDNTPRGAAKRMQYLLQHGAPPEGWTYDSYELT